MNWAKTVFFCVFAGISTFPALGQLAAPNEAGVRMGHMHLAVKDVDAQKQFWIGAMGGTLVKSGALELIQFPGVFVMLRKAEPTGPPEGTVVNHFGFVLKDLETYKARWKAAGVEFKPNENPKAGFVFGPDGIRIEVFENPVLPVPIRMDHIHFFASDVPGMKAWYAKTFGATPGQRKCVSCVSKPRMIETDDIPGVNLSFNNAASAMAATKGRSIDHIGFDVTNLDQFAKKMEAQGVKFDIAPRQIPNSKTKISFITDPWGTYIEVTEGLAP